MSGFGLFAMLCIGLLGAWEARNLARQRAELTRTAAARLRSEASSRIQTVQQMEVARFGQLALEGADINALTTEATRLMESVLGIDVGGVMKLLPTGKSCS